MTKILGWFTGINILLGAVILGGCMIYTHLSLPAFASAPYLDDPYREEDLQIRIIRDTQRQLYRREAVVAKPWYFNYVWEEDGEVHEISLTVSQRYVTDFASIPVYAGWFVSPFGKHSEASVVHDYLYSIGGLTRREVDALLYAEMRKSGVDPFRAALVYSSVRFRGNPAFGRDNEWTDNFYDVVAQDRLPEGCMPSREEATKVSQTVLGTEEWNRNVAEGEFLFRSEQRAYEQENYLYDLWYGKYSAPACKEWLADGIKRLIEEKYLVATTNADKAIRGDITVYEVAAYNYLQRFKPSDELLAADMMLERLCTTDESIETWCSTQDGSGISLESDRDPE
ncbi:DUF1353 domain-containing protein [Parvularcula marina]|uniref:DUF1353 domain-containing protein n=1 Tax=Parvularcula marina TaxID=2292771 RepID=A0A371RGQ6_9PROT|nr:DUF1353 domain-containing protein [Parvularcula marina]RFB04636.1 DUF1353 domain-containing protein [Parvularcula marina]